jgi:hypothetical protein
MPVAGAQVASAACAAPARRRRALPLPVPSARSRTSSASQVRKGSPPNPKTITWHQPVVPLCRLFFPPGRTPRRLASSLLAWTPSTPPSPAHTCFADAQAEHFRCQFPAARRVDESRSILVSCNVLVSPACGIERAAGVVEHARACKSTVFLSVTSGILIV